MGALEARLHAARLQEEAKASLARKAQAARDAVIRAHASESAELVREFIDRAVKLRIKPTRSLPSVVQQKLTQGYKGMWGVKSETVLESRVTRCWHLGTTETGRPSKAYPGGHSFNYYLSEDGKHVVPEVHEEARKTWFTGMEWYLRTVTWKATDPHIGDIVMTENRGGESDESVTLLDAMERFFRQRQ